MTYDEWKSYITEKININTQKIISNDPTTKFYWPESNNFKKLTEPFAKENNNVFKCYTTGFSTSEEIENFIENSNNIGIYYIAKYIDDPLYKFHMRFIDFDNHGLTGISAEEYYQQNKEEFFNCNTTIKNIKEQMNDIENLDFIYIQRRKAIDSENSALSLYIETELTDGNMIYV